MPISDDFYSVPQAAEVLGCTTGRVRQLLIEGSLHGEKYSDAENAPWLLPRKEVDDLSKVQQTTGRPRKSAS